MWQGNRDNDFLIIKRNTESDICENGAEVKHPPKLSPMWKHGRTGKSSSETMF